MKNFQVGLAAFGVALVFVACSSARFVDEVVLVNPTAFTANVAVTGETRSGWLGLATAEARSEATVREVQDQGATWVFRFSYAGYEEEVRLARSELAGSGWRVTVPASFEAELRSRGVVPPP